jgi:hypothetical protein
MRSELSWRKSSYSGGSGGNCVELAAEPNGRVLIRDTKDRSGPVLAVSPAAFRELVNRLLLSAN